MIKPNIINNNFPLKQYYQDEYKKEQIFLHHTVSGDNIDGDISWWKQTPSRIATCVIIARNGEIHRLYSSKKWAHHLGIKSWIFKKFGLSSYRANLNINKKSIGVELDSWGGIIKRNGKFYRTGNKEISSEKVIDYGREIRGFRYYEKYTTEQLASLKYLLIYWGKFYGIDLKYREDMWTLNIDCLSGKNGIWSHVSCRPDKSDCHPQPELIKMLKSLD